MAEIEDRGHTCDCGLREANTALRQRVAELEAERDRRRELLGRVEWAGRYVDAYNASRRACPACGGIKPGEVAVSDYAKSIRGHRKDCAMAVALGRATEP